MFLKSQSAFLRKQVGKSRRYHSPITALPTRTRVKIFPIALLANNASPQLLCVAVKHSRLLKDAQKIAPTLPVTLSSKWSSGGNGTHGLNAKFLSRRIKSTLRI